MAGSWIKLETVTPDKPEVEEIADLLDIDQDLALGKLARFWCWADGVADDTGFIPRVTGARIDRRFNCPGFSDALVTVGWLEGVDDGGVTLPRFGMHGNGGAKTRANNAARQAKKRAGDKDAKKSGVTGSKGKKTESHAEGDAKETHPVTQDRDRVKQKNAPEKSREEKSREEKTTPLSSPPVASERDDASPQPPAAGPERRGGGAPAGALDGVEGVRAAVAEVFDLPDVTERDEKRLWRLAHDFAARLPAGSGHAVAQKWLTAAVKKHRKTWPDMQVTPNSIDTHWNKMTKDKASAGTGLASLSPADLAALHAQVVEQDPNLRGYGIGAAPVKQAMLRALRDTHKKGAA